MTEHKPVSIAPETDPTTPEDTVITARFNKTKIAKIAATLTGVVGALAVFGSVQKLRGENEALRDLVDEDTETADETATS